MGLGRLCGTRTEAATEKPAPAAPNCRVDSVESGVVACDAMRTVSCVIITRHRPDMVRECLEHLGRERDSDTQVIVVDNSDPGRVDTEDVARAGGAEVVRIRPCRNVHPFARNRGADRAHGEIIAFLDDDSMVQSGWLKACRESYDDPAVGAAGGIILDPEVEGLDHRRTDRINRLLRNGAVTDDCDCDPGRILDVHHLRGCNLSIRRDIFEQLGGCDENMTGDGWFEVDMLTRGRQLGYRVVYNPPMRVYHKLHPRLYEARERMSYRRTKGLLSNMSYIHAKNFGPFSPLYLRFLFTYQTMAIALLRRPSRQVLVRAIAGVHGKAQGLLRYVRVRRRLLAGGRLLRVLQGVDGNIEVDAG